MSDVPGIQNIDQLRQVDCREYIARYVNLGHGGEYVRGHCPFHKDKTPSFTVYADHYYCYGCHKTGDVFTFIQELRGVEFAEAAEIVADENGIALEWAEGAGHADRPGRQEMREALAAAERHYVSEFQECDRAVEYAEGRGLSAELRQEWGVGYAYGNSVSEAADPELLSTVGVLYESEASGKYVDPLAGRLIIPHRDPGGRVVAFTGRVLSGNVSARKYVHTRETLLNRKSRRLFGFARAREMMRELSRAGESPEWLVLEGELAVIAAQAADIPAVAPSGSAFSADQVRLLGDYPVQIGFDADEAGRSAVCRAAAVFQAAGRFVSVAQLCVPADHDDDEGLLDADDLLARGLPVEYESEGLLEWAVRTWLPERGGPGWVEAMRDRVLPLTQHASALQTRIHRERLARILSVPLDALVADAAGAAAAEVSAPDPRGATPAVDVDRTMSTTRMLFAVCLQAAYVPSPNWWERYVKMSRLRPKVLAVLSEIGQLRDVAARDGLPLLEVIKSRPRLARAPYYKYWSTVPVGEITPQYLIEVLHEVYQSEKLEMQREGI